MAIGRLGETLTVTPGLETFAEPLDALLAEHYRQRTMCDLLDQLADNLTSPEAPDLARTILKYLREQLPLHVLDEERDLFQLLRDLRWQPKRSRKPSRSSAASIPKMPAFPLSLWQGWTGFRPRARLRT